MVNVHRIRSGEASFASRVIAILLDRIVEGGMVGAARPRRLMVIGQRAVVALAYCMVRGTSGKAGLVLPIDDERQDSSCPSMKAGHSSSGLFALVRKVSPPLVPFFYPSVGRLA